MLLELQGGPLDGEWVDVNPHVNKTASFTFIYDARRLKIDAQRKFSPKNRRYTRYAEYKLATCDEFARLVFVQSWSGKAKPK